MWNLIFEVLGLAPDLAERLNVERRRLKTFVVYAILYLLGFIAIQSFLIDHKAAVIVCCLLSVVITALIIWMRWGPVVDFALVFNPFKTRDIIAKCVRKFLLVQILSTILFVSLPPPLWWYALGVSLFTLGVILSRWPVKIIPVIGIIILSGIAIDRLAQDTNYKEKGWAKFYTAKKGWAGDKIETLALKIKVWQAEEGQRQARADALGNQTRDLVAQVVIPSIGDSTAVIDSSQTVRGYLQRGMNVYVRYKEKIGLDGLCYVKVKRVVGGQVETEGYVFISDIKDAEPTTKRPEPEVCDIGAITGVPTPPTRPYRSYWVTSGTNWGNAPSLLKLNLRDGEHFEIRSTDGKSLLGTRFRLGDGEPVRIENEHPTDSQYVHRSQVGHNWYYEKLRFASDSHRTLEVRTFVN